METALAMSELLNYRVRVKLKERQYNGPEKRDRQAEK
jgi:hypothetical protein